MGNQSLLEAIINPLKTWARINSPFAIHLQQRLVQRVRHRDPGHAHAALRPRTVRRQAPGQPAARRRADLHRPGDAAVARPARCASTSRCPTRSSSSPSARAASPAASSRAATTSSAAWRTSSRCNAFVPGCPPRPEAIIYGVVALLNSLKQPAPSPEAAAARGLRTYDMDAQQNLVTAEALLQPYHGGRRGARAGPGRRRDSASGPDGRGQARSWARGGATSRPSPASIIPGRSRRRRRRSPERQRTAGTAGPVEDRLEALYHFVNGAAVATLRVSVPYHDTRLPTICPLIPSATLYERELQEMFGFVVEGTPDPGPIAAARRLAGRCVSAAQGVQRSRLVVRPDGRGPVGFASEDGGPSARQRGRDGHSAGRSQEVRGADRAAAPGAQGAGPLRDHRGRRDRHRRHAAAGLRAPRHREGRRAAELGAGHVHARAGLRDLLAHPRHRLRARRRGAGRGAGAAARAGDPGAGRRTRARAQPPALARRRGPRRRASTRCSCIRGATAR